MILYHFTSKDLAEKIEKEGITLGGVFLPSMVFGGGRRLGSVCKGFIWLTDDPRFNAQNWATNHTGLVGDRTEVRFKVDIPFNVMTWAEAAKKTFKLMRADIAEFNMAGGSDGSHWYLLQGTVLPQWIIERVDRGSI